MKQFRGVGVALVTPFKEDGSIDFTSLQRLVNHVVDGGVNYLVAMGTTGESVTLTKEEKTAAVKCILDTNKGRVPVVLGIGGNNTQEVCDTIKATNFNGIDAILSVSPMYNKPTQEGIYQHYKAINAVSSKPIIIYNVPGRTGANISADTTLRIAKDLKNVIGIKEAAGNMSQYMTLIRDTPKDFLVISGDDDLVMPVTALGGDGVISVVANAFPAEFSTMVQNVFDADLEGARKIHYGLLEIIGNLFVEGNPAGIKATLKILGVTGDDIRLPLVKVSVKTYKKLEELVDKLKLVRV